jgi:hypothetical protein
LVSVAGLLSGTHDSVGAEEIPPWFCGCKLVGQAGNQNWTCKDKSGNQFDAPLIYSSHLKINYEYPKNPYFKSIPSSCTTMDNFNRYAGYSDRQSALNDIIAEMTSNILKLSGGRSTRGSGTSSGGTQSTLISSLSDLSQLGLDNRATSHAGYSVEAIDFEKARNADYILNKYDSTADLSTLRSILSSAAMSPQWGEYTYLARSSVRTPQGTMVSIYKVCFDVTGTDRQNTLGGEEIIASSGISPEEKRSAVRLGIWSIFNSFKTSCRGGLSPAAIQSYDKYINSI